MKWLGQLSLYGRNKHLVELEGDEGSLPNAILVSIADGVPRARAVEIHEKKEHPPHFGGSVTKLTKEGVIDIVNFSQRAKQPYDRYNVKIINGLDASKTYAEITVYTG